jgi:hypothetical protein
MTGDVRCRLEIATPIVPAGAGFEPDAKPRFLNNQFAGWVVN